MESPVAELPRHRSLAPREHGAYGQLAVPMLAALAGGRPGPAPLLLAVAAWALFFAHEPALVLLGRRGERVRVAEGRRSAARLWALGAAGAALGGAGWMLSPPAARWAALAPALLGAIFAALVALGLERSAPGEALAAVTLAGVAFPIAVASGIGVPPSARAWLVWSIGLTALVLPVRSIGARRRAGSSLAGRLLPALVGAGLGLGLFGTVFTPLDLAALAPLVLTSAWLAVAPPDPRRLRGVGWSIVGSTLLTAAALVAAGRGVVT